MRTRFALLVVLLVPAFAAAQTADVIVGTPDTNKFVRDLQHPVTGAFRATPEGPLGLRASLAGVRAEKYLRVPPRYAAVLTAFVLKCYDPETGGFADAPGGKPDVPTTAVGVMAAVELGIPEAKFPKAVAYLKANTKTFEDARLGAAALETLKAKPEWVGDWMKLADAELAAAAGDGAARAAGGAAAMKLRLGFDLPNRATVVKTLIDGQRDDGAWGKAGAKSSDLETTYRVMRALVLLKEKPADLEKLGYFVARCGNPDGGYAVVPGGPSNVGATYYAAIIGHWLDGMK